jgi:hypothetical protein
MFQATTSIVLKTISTIIAVITVVGSYKVLSPSPQYNPMDLLVIAIIIIVIVIMRHYVAKIVDETTDSWSVIMESIGEIHYFWRNPLKHTSIN